MQTDRLQPQRFELKFLVTERVALAARDFVSGYLVLDENCAGKPDNSYPNHSLYLDSPELRFYWDVVNGNRNRYKLRVRFYDEDPGSPVFCEIKQRQSDAILKQRAPVRREALAGLLAGELPDPGHLFNPSPKYMAALQRFSDLMLAQRAVPQTHVSYLREAWVSEQDNSARVTFDRAVCIERHATAELRCSHEHPVMPWGGQVILELKFTGRFPNWYGDLARVFGIVQCGVAKYAEGVAALGEDRFPNLLDSAEQALTMEKFVNSRFSGRATKSGENIAA